MKLSLIICRQASCVVEEGIKKGDTGRAATGDTDRAGDTTEDTDAAADTLADTDNLVNSGNLVSSGNLDNYDNLGNFCNLVNFDSLEISGNLVNSWHKARQYPVFLSLWS